MKKIIFTLSATILFVGCDKGADSFSVLSESSVFQVETKYEPRKLDVLFVVDNSASMGDEQVALQNNFSSFIDRFIDRGFDFRIAVITTEAYRYPQFGSTNCNNTGNRCTKDLSYFRKGASVPESARVIKSIDYDLTSNTDRTLLKTHFAGNALVGTNGSGDERSFSSFDYALKLQENIDYGFRRPGAYLAIVIVSDEEDFSKSTYTLTDNPSDPNLYPVSDYVNSLNLLTSGKPSKDYSVSVITGLPGEPCSSAYREAPRHVELATLTGGTASSICQSFATSLDYISSNIESQGLSEFKLNRVPLVSTVQVLIDGISVPKSDINGWSYEALNNTIKINGPSYKPSKGSLIKINFDPDVNAIVN